MHGEYFTWFPKFTRTVEFVPEEQRGLLLWALVKFGTDGEEIELPYPLNMAFESLRDDIEHSKTNRTKNKGGRPKKSTSIEAEADVSQLENPGLETKKPGLKNAKTKVSESNNQGYESSKPKTIQNNTKQYRTEHKNTKQSVFDAYSKG